MSKELKLKSVLVTGGAGFIGSNLVLEIQARFPGAWITVVDNFQSGKFKNLVGFKGDVVAADVSKLNWAEYFGKPRWDVVFHLASWTDTRMHDQFSQVHDNVEGFRRLLEFVGSEGTPVIYASSAATYGIRKGVNREDDEPAPANVYAFSKMVMDNLARRYAALDRDRKIVGLRYFNVYGPREAHKGNSASMIHQLAVQMAKNENPVLFKFGEQRRDFIYVKDVVACTLAAWGAPGSGIYNVGTGRARSFNELVGILNGILGKKLQPKYCDNLYSFYQPHTEADTTRARADLGFEAKFGLEEGVKDYFDSGFLTLEE